MKGNLIIMGCFAAGIAGPFYGTCTRGDSGYFSPSQHSQRFPLQ